MPSVDLFGEGKISLRQPLEKEVQALLWLILDDAKGKITLDRDRLLAMHEYDEIILEDHPTDVVLRLRRYETPFPGAGSSDAPRSMVSIPDGTKLTLEDGTHWLVANGRWKQL